MRIPRPISIANYNIYMGGVDLADMKRMQCSSMIMGLSRWWLKLFFYLLDVGTGNTLVLYNEQVKVNSKGQEYTILNVADFKMKLVEDLVGKSLLDRRNGTHVCSDPRWPKSQVRVLRTHVARDQNKVHLCCMWCSVVFYGEWEGKIRLFHQSSQNRGQGRHGTEEASTDANEKSKAKLKIK